MVLATEISVLTVLKVGNSKIMVLDNSVPGEDFRSGLEMTTFPLYSHMVERGSSGVPSSSYKAPALLD